MQAFVTKWYIFLRVLWKYYINTHLPCFCFRLLTGCTNNISSRLLWTYQSNNKKGINKWSGLGKTEQKIWLSRRPEQRESNTLYKKFPFPNNKSGSKYNAKKAEVARIDSSAVTLPNLWVFFFYLISRLANSRPDWSYHHNHNPFLPKRFEKNSEGIT